MQVMTSTEIFRSCKLLCPRGRRELIAVNPRRRTREKQAAQGRPGAGSADSISDAGLSPEGDDDGGGEGITGQSRGDVARPRASEARAPVPALRVSRCNHLYPECPSLHPGHLGHWKFDLIWLPKPTVHHSKNKKNDQGSLFEFPAPFFALSDFFVLRWGGGGAQK